MRLDRFLAKSRILDLKSTDFSAALAEMLASVSERILSQAGRAQALKELLSREKNISTYLGNGICMPHARIPIRQKYVFIVGRCKSGGLNFDGVKEYKSTRLVFMLLAGEEESSYLHVLASLARVFAKNETISAIVDAPSAEAFKERVIKAFSAGETKTRKQNKTNVLFLKQAYKIAKGAKCAKILVLGDTFGDGFDLDKYFRGFKVVLVSEKSGDSFGSLVSDTINIRAFSRTRLAQVKSAIIVGLAKGIFAPTDKLCCIGGVRNSNLIDTIVLIDLATEFANIFANQKNILPASVKPEVIERVIDIATELSVEGREGKPVGCIFVVGDVDKLRPFIKQLILNPFHGYNPEDRNVLNPFMDETVKEFSIIDGAFIIDGSGVLESAGSLLHTPDFVLQLPGGLGARHAAAYSISLAADCISLVVSSSTGQLTMFRRGQMLPLTEKKKL